MNIFSGEGGLGSALTNPTELARSKGKLDKAYPITIDGFKYADAEAAYQARKIGEEVHDDCMMEIIICGKLTQHMELFEEIKERGGVEFLERCTHITYAKSERGQAWEGVGRGSRFIRNLIGGYRKAILVIEKSGLEF